MYIYIEHIYTYIYTHIYIYVTITSLSLSLSLARARALSPARCELFLIDGFPRNDDNLVGWNDIVGNSVYYTQFTTQFTTHTHTIFALLRKQITQAGTNLSASLFTTHTLSHFSLSYACMKLSLLRTHK